MRPFTTIWGLTALALAAAAILTGLGEPVSPAMLAIVVLVVAALGSLTYAVFPRREQPEAAGFAEAETGLAPEAD